MTFSAKASGNTAKWASGKPLVVTSQTVLEARPAGLGRMFLSLYSPCESLTALPFATNLSPPQRLRGLSYFSLCISKKYFLLFTKKKTGSKSTVNLSLTELGMQFRFHQTFTFRRIHPRSCIPIANL